MRIKFFFRFLFFLIFQSLKEKFTEQKKGFGSTKTKYWPKRYRMVNTSSEFKLFFLALFWTIGMITIIINYT